MYFFNTPQQRMNEAFHDGDDNVDNVDDDYVYNGYLQMVNIMQHLKYKVSLYAVSY